MLSKITSRIKGSPLSWRRLIVEGVVIVLFLLVWYLLSGILIGAGLGMVANAFLNEGGGGILWGTLLVFLGLVFFAASTFIVQLRVFGQAISRGLRDFTSKTNSDIIKEDG